MTSDVVVIGSGVIGASIAYHLAREGVAVTLADRSDEAATSPSASWASAGGLRSQGRHAEDRPISRAAALRWQTLSQELDANLEASFGGHLHIAEHENEVGSIDARIAGDAAAGLATERVNAETLRGIAPALTSRALAGAFSPGDGQAHPARTARAFARAAGRAGAHLAFGQEASINLSQNAVAAVALGPAQKIDAGVVVLAAGAWSIEILSTLGIELPLRWRGLQMLLSDLAPPMLTPTVTAAGRNLSLKQTPAGQFMIGGRWFAQPGENGIGSRCVDAHVARQWSGAAAIVPALRERRLVQSWSGVEAQSIDGLPFIGRTSVKGLYLATGFSNHGFQISPEIGRLVAQDLMTGCEPLLAPFNPHRHAALPREKADAFKAETILC